MVRLKDGLLRTWLMRYAWMAPHPPARVAQPAATPQPRPLAVPLEYLSLHKYLDGRFADKVVLTFAQMEDLLGFALPEFARRDPVWWANTDANNAPSPQARSWIDANRTATPNLAAQTVAFERGAV